MASAIDPNFITTAPVSKVGMRTQLATARDEITALQGRVTVVEAAVAGGGGGGGGDPPDPVPLRQIFVVGGNTLFTASESLAGGPFFLGEDCRIAGNLVGTRVKVHANPSGAAVINVYSNEVIIGVINISTAGVVTMTTTDGLSVIILNTATFDCRAPAVADATLKCSITFNLEVV